MRAVALAETYPDLAITVVDDQSSDATGAIWTIARSTQNAGRLRVIHGVQRPEGWLGKTWALQQGVAAARAEWLWFVDGDIVLDRHALATAWHEAARRNADLVSIFPGSRCESFWQSIISLALGNMLVQLYPLNQVNDPRRPNMALPRAGSC